MQVAGILDHFELPKKDYTLRILKQGLIHKTYLVESGGKVDYVLQRINTRVFPDIKALMNNLSLALPYLHAEDYQAIELVPAKEGGFFADTGKGCWRLMTYIPDSITFNTTTDLKVAEEAGRIIARFHHLLRPAPINEFAETLTAFHDLHSRQEQFWEALESAPSKRREHLKNELEGIGELLNIPFPFHSRELPIRICHNDTKLNNILFSETSRNALCLIDLDTIMKGHVAYDFGDAVRTIVNKAPEDEKRFEKIGFSRSLFEAFSEGFALDKDLYTAEEVSSLAYGVIYMPLIHGVRALADYLSGDRYYQVAYERQNLDRGLSLLNFAQKARLQFAYMQDVTGEKMKA